MARWRTAIDGICSRKLASHRTPCSSKGESNSWSLSSLAAKRPEGGLKLGAVETVRRHNRLVRFWSDSQSHQMVLRVAQPGCRAGRELLQQRVFGIAGDL